MDWLVLRVQVNNSLTQNIDFQFKIRCLDAPEDANVDCPISSLYSTIPSKHLKEVCTLVKKVPGREWGNLDWSYRFQEEENQAPQLTPTSSHQAGEFAADYDMPYAPVQGRQVSVELDMSDGTASCPKCTYLNAANAMKCDMCGSLMS